MDTIKILFGLVAALLVGALAYSWKDFKAARAREPKEKVAEVRREIAMIRESQAKMKSDRDRITGVAPPPSAADPLAVSTDASAVDLAAIDAASSLGEAPPGETPPKNLCVLEQNDANGAQRQKGRPGH